MVAMDSGAGGTGAGGSQDQPAPKKSRGERGGKNRSSKRAWHWKEQHGFWPPRIPPPASTLPSATGASASSQEAPASEVPPPLPPLPPPDQPLLPPPDHPTPERESGLDSLLPLGAESITFDIAACTHKGRGLVVDLSTDSALKAVCPRLVKARAQMQDSLATMVIGQNDPRRGGIAAVLAFTADIRNDGDTQDGEIFFELNKALRDRTPVGIDNLHRTWGCFLRYLREGLRLRPNYVGVAFRILRNAIHILEQYEVGKVICWGSFVSATTDADAALQFVSTDRSLQEVACKINITDARTLGDLSCFPDEQEVFFWPDSKFAVTATRCSIYSNPRPIMIVYLLFMFMSLVLTCICT